MQKVMRGIVSAALVAAGVGAGTASAETKLTFNKWVEEVKIGGDVRFRQENFDNSGGTVDRQRQRIRLRVSSEFKLPHNMAVKTRVASGEDQDQVSTNQTLTNNAEKKSINIDLAFLKWAPKESIDINAGKMDNPFWTIAASDLMWDSDYTPEGLSEGWEGLLGPVDVFVAAGQFAIEERSTSLEDAYLFSEQAGVEVKLPLESRLRTAVAHHEFANIKQGGIDGAGAASGTATNTAGAGFSILEWTSALNFWLGRTPVSVQGSYVKNNAAPKTTVGGALATAEEQDTGVHVGAVVGKAKKGKLEFAYFYKEVERDAVVSGITDSDLPNTTNAKGHIGWIAYGITDFVTAQIKHFDAERKVVAAGAADGSVNRTQFDVSVKF